MSRPRILWGLTGSVATIRAGALANQLLEVGEVRAVVTRRARHFLEPLPTTIPTFDDDDEWDSWKKLGDEVLHIELRKWADVFLIAPVTADCLAKVSNGLSDTLLLSVARAWDFEKPFVLAPAMNTKMWEHPVTSEHLAKVANWGVQIVEPVAKKLACSDVGMGGLAPPETISAFLARTVAPAQ